MRNLYVCCLKSKTGELVYVLDDNYILSNRLWVTGFIVNHNKKSITRASVYIDKEKSCVSIFPHKLNTVGDNSIIYQYTIDMCDTIENHKELAALFNHTFTGTQAEHKLIEFITGTI